MIRAAKRMARLALLLVLVGCAGSATTAPTPPLPSGNAPNVQPEDAGSPPPGAAGGGDAAAGDALIRIIVEQSVGYERALRADKLKAAVEVATKVVNDPEFGQTMRTYPGIHSLPGFSQASLFGGGVVKSSDQPMSELLRGNASDGQIHVLLSIEDHGNEDGHTTQNAAHTGVTFSRGKIIDEMTVAQLADHLVHEHMHRIGFQHAQHRSLERCDSVPYSFGRTVCEFATRKYGLPGSCDKPSDWPPQEPRKHPEPGPRC